MRYVFIVNPRAGVKNITEDVRRKAESFFKEEKESFTVYETTGVGDATRIAKKECEKGTAVRIYGFGGDGTLLEIARGCEGKANAEVGIFPTGSGNDYVRTYSQKEDFLNFENQINGDSIEVDMISTEGGSALNICSVGFDARVAFEMTGLKKIPWVSGSLAYNMALVKCLFKKLGDKLCISICAEGETQKYSGLFMFALAASGKYYGGGYMGAPKARTDDGLLDFVLIEVPPFYKIPKMVGLYKKGLHIGNSFFDSYLIFCRGTQMVISGEKDLCCNRDGECDTVIKESFSVITNGLRFILPKGIKY